MPRDGTLREALPALARPERAGRVRSGGRWFSLPGARTSRTSSRACRRSGPVNRHPQFEPGMTGILLGGRPHAQPVRAAVGADADQVEGLPAFPGLGRRVMLEQHERGPVPAGELGPDLPGRLGDRGRRAGLGDHGQVAGLTTGRQPHPEVSNTLPGGADRVPPERFVGDQLTERRQAIRRGWRQDPRFLPAG